MSSIFYSLQYSVAINSMLYKIYRLVFQCWLWSTQFYCNPKILHCFYLFNFTRYNNICTEFCVWYSKYLSWIIRLFSKLLLLSVVHRSTKSAIFCWNFRFQPKPTVYESALYKMPRGYEFILNIRKQWIKRYLRMKHIRMLK